MIEIKGLTKVYHNKHLALDNFDLSLTGGKIVGLLGPNGSGKTTLIKILAGLLTATEGTVKIDGKPIGEQTKAIVSYLPERTYFSPSMKVCECLNMFQDFYEDFDRKRAEDMLAALQIPLNSKFKTLSKGTKEKVQLVVVMSRQAKVYLLDEPIAGVDPAARDYIMDTIIKNYNPEATVIISTHLIYDIESVLDEFVFIYYGKLVEHGVADQVREEKGMNLDNYFREKFRYQRPQGGEF